MAFLCMYDYLLVGHIAYVYFTLYCIFVCVHTYLYNIHPRTLLYDIRVNVQMRLCKAWR